MRSVFVVVAVLLLSGCQGKPGPEGPQGEPGQGGSGLAAGSHCVGSIDLDGSGIPFNLEYDTYTFNDGSVMATCVVHSSGLQTSGVEMYKAGSTNISTAQCQAEFSTISTSSGTWLFLTSGGAATATYVDAQSSYNGHSANLTCHQS
jgi:hypothetical protein